MSQYFIDPLLRSKLKAIINIDQKLKFWIKKGKNDDKNIVFKENKK